MVELPKRVNNKKNPEDDIPYNDAHGKPLPKTIVLVTGGFDPLHSGHIAYFEAAKAMGDHLAIGVNSDAWLKRKKGRHFMPLDERGAIISKLEMVDQVVGFEDEYDADDSCVQFIKDMREYNPEAKIVFANGGDRQPGTTPEEKAGIEKVSFAFGVGGTDKKNSSSWILKDWEAPKVERDWGHYRELYKGAGFAVKELVINPHSSLSMQRHKHRSETWNLVSGTAHLLTSNRTIPEDPKRQNLSPPNPVDIPANVWHKGVNESNEPAHIIEVWKGAELTEDDIERQD
ncbi:adenylyltransferase/cytidyltransferase family protein [bacterium]|nr:adenylyltransferase/cytidyltransferase family protein [bacterium]